MDYKFTLVINNVTSKDEAIEAINEMLDAYDFYCRKVEDDPGDEITIDWPYDQGCELLPDLDA